MDDDPYYLLVYNGLFVEINANGENWKYHKVYIYDELGDITDEEIKYLRDYLYSEGFIEDRRTNYEVVRGEDFI